MPLSERLGISTTYTEAQLYKATEEAIVRANALHQQLALNDSTKVTLPFTHDEIYRIAHEAYPLEKKWHHRFSRYQECEIIIIQQATYLYGL